MGRLLRLTRDEKIVVEQYGGYWPREMRATDAARRRAQWELDDKLRRMDLRSWREYLDELRRLNQPKPKVVREGSKLREDRRVERSATVSPVGEPDLPRYVRQYLASEPGNPLGKGMPLGASLRRDGETHREWWMRVMRADPCAYCGRVPAGTVDHVEPQSRRARGLGGAHSWTNYVGACESCNGGKGALDLLTFLHRRAPRRKVTRIPQTVWEDHTPDQMEAAA